MNKSKLDRPHIKMLIAGMLAAGSSQRKIAKLFSTSQATILRLGRQADMLEMIQREEDKLMQTTESVLAKIRTDPVFLAEFQKEVERLFFKYLKGW